MNKISLSNNYIYEFDIDIHLVDSAFDFFMSKKSQWWNQLSREQPQSDMSPEYIYFKDNGNIKPFYHKELFDQIQLCLDQVSKIHFASWKLGVCDAWVTQTKFGQSSGWHKHFNSLFSGLLYFSDDDDAPTEFHLPDDFFKRMTSMFRNHLIKEQKYSLFYKPKKGKLLIWDSQLTHRISASKSKQIRHTLAFNTWPQDLVDHFPTAILKTKLVDEVCQPN